MASMADIVGIKLKSNIERKHKTRPTQFLSVANGVKKRVDDNAKYRKSCRLTVFDIGRKLSIEETPEKAPLNELELKLQKRMLQLEKWKEEREKHKKAVASQKKKPFLTGVYHVSLKFELPPPVKPMPSTSGRVTRSQSSRTNILSTNIEPKKLMSIAPKHAKFNPPKLNNVPQLLSLEELSRNKPVPVVTFDPVQHKTSVMTRNQRNRLAKGTADETSKQFKTTNEKKSLTNKIDKNTIKNKVVSPKKAKSVVTKKQLNNQLSANNLKSLQNINLQKPSISGFVLQTISSDNTKGRSRSRKSQDSQKSQEFQKLQLPDQVSKDISKISNKDTEIKLRARKYQDQDSVSSDQTAKDNGKTTKTKAIKVKKSPKKKRTSVNKLKNTKNSNKVETVINPETVPLICVSQSSIVTPKMIPKSESRTEEKIRSPKMSETTPAEIVEAVKNMSPGVTMSRGKDNARKETMQKLKEGLLEEYSEDTDSINHYRRLLTSQTARLTEMCTTWEKVAEDRTIPEDVEGLLMGAIGQAKLLMTKKMEQFSRLVDSCAAACRDGPLVKVGDLAGFWELVVKQIQDVDLRFEKLGKLRDNKWAEPEKLVQKKVPAKIVRKVTKPKAPAASSRLKDMIAAARKNQQQQQPLEDKVFEAGFFSVRSPARSPGAVAPATPVGGSLLKSVLSAEAKKASSSARKSCTSFAMLRASLLAKDVDIIGVCPLEITPLKMTPINFKATPARSILKSANVTNTKKPVKKSLKIVLFDKDNEDEESNKSVNENVFHETVEPIAAGNTDSGVSSMESEEAKSGKENTPSTKKAQKKLERQKAIDEPQETNRRSSRNKPFENLDTNIDTPRSRRKSDLMEFETPIATPRRSTRLSKKDFLEVEEPPKRSNRRGRKSAA